MAWPHVVLSGVRLYCKDRRGNIACLGVFALVQVAAGEIPPLQGLPVGLLLAAAGGVWLWMFFAASYEIAEWDLVWRLGPFRWRVPLDAVEEAEATNGCRVVGGLAWPGRCGWCMSSIGSKMGGGPSRSRSCRGIGPASCGCWSVRCPV